MKVKKEEENREEAKAVYKSVGPLFWHFGLLGLRVCLARESDPNVESSTRLIDWNYNRGFELEGVSFVLSPVLSPEFPDFRISGFPDFRFRISDFRISGFGIIYGINFAR